MSSKELFSYKRLAPALIVFFLGLSYVAQIYYDAWLRYGDSKVKVSYNVFIEPQPMSPAIAKAVSFGATEFLADYYWLQFIQYYGGGDPNGIYRKMPELLNTITDLSPKFLIAYQTGLLDLPAEGYVSEAIALGEKGERNLPGSWEIPYYTGLVYHVYKKDFVNAAKQFDLAATIPGAPAITKLFAGIYHSNANERQIAYAIFKNVYDTSNDQYIKERAGKYVGHLEGLFALQDAVGKFKEQYGRLPNNLNELVSHKIISAIPVSPLETSYSYDPATGNVSDSKK